MECDGLFLGYLAYADAMAHRSELADMAACQFPTMPLTGLVVCINHATAPPHYSLVPLKNFTLKDCVYDPSTARWDTKPHMRAILDSVKAQQKNVTLVKLIFMSGSLIEVIIACGGFLWAEQVDQDYGCGVVRPISGGDRAS